MTKEYDTQHDILLKHIKATASSSSSTSSGSSTSSSSSSSLKKAPPVITNSVKHDLGYLISDLRSACGDLCSLIRQIDTIAHKVEEKFGFIINSLEYAYTTSSSSSSEAISDKDSMSEIGSLTNGNLKIANHLHQISCLSNEQILSEFLKKQQQAVTQTTPISISNKHTKSSSCKITPKLNQDTPKTADNSFIVYNTDTIFENKKRNSKVIAPALNEEITENSSTIADVAAVSSSSNKRSMVNYITKDGCYSVLNKNSKNVRSKSQPTCKNQHSRQQLLEANENSEKIHATMESSFYEDKLDNELESFSYNQALVSIDSNFSSNESEPPSRQNSERQSKTVTKANTIAEKSTCSASKVASKSTNHVCFNLNNAIYTTRQDTPIPISILKGTSFCDDTNGSLNSNNKKSNIKLANRISSAGNNILLQKCENMDETNSITSTSSSRKSSNSDTAKEMDHLNTTNSPLQSSSSKYTKEPKTTIL